MKPVTEYIRFVDGCLADATSKKNDVLRVDLLFMPTAVVATFTVLPAIILMFAGVSAEWGSIPGTLFFWLIALHFLVLFWRWSVFDSEEYTGKKPRSAPRGF